MPYIIAYRNSSEIYHLENSIDCRLYTNHNEVLMKFSELQQHILEDITIAEMM